MQSVIKSKKKKIAIAWVCPRLHVHICIIVYVCAWNNGNVRVHFRFSFLSEEKSFIYIWFPLTLCFALHRCRHTLKYTKQQNTHDTHHQKKKKKYWVFQKFALDYQFNESWSADSNCNREPDNCVWNWIKNLNHTLKSKPTK